MKLFNYTLGFVMVTAAVVAGTTKTVQAVTPANDCKVVGVGVGQAGTSFTVDGETITARYTVTGTNCTTPVTLTVWNSPSANGQPIDKQTVFNYTTQFDVAPGTHTISAKLPKDGCYYQADLVQSDKAKAADGTANYDYQNGQIIDGGLRDYIYGGTKKCDPKTPEEPPKTPEQPQPPTTGGQGQVQGVQTPTELIHTGPASFAGAFMGVSTTAGIAHSLIQRRRKV